MASTISFHRDSTDSTRHVGHPHLDPCCASQRQLCFDSFDRGDGNGNGDQSWWGKGTESLKAQSNYWAMQIAMKLSLSPAIDMGIMMNHEYPSVFDFDGSSSDICG